MDWDLIIERNGKALRRVLAMLVAMAGLGGENTLPHHLHRRLLVLLRPTEAAVRRLIIIVARDLVVTLPPARPKPKPSLNLAAHAALRRLGLAVVIAPGNDAFAALARAGAANRTAPARPWPTDLPLLDPLTRPFRRSQPFALARAVPRIWVPGMPNPTPIPRRPLPGDPVDATRLGQRLARVAAALDDLPRHAQRFARWMARRARARSLGKHPRWPLRPGYAPGVRRPHSHRPPHEIDAVGMDTDYFAKLVLEPRDTS